MADPKEQWANATLQDRMMLVGAAVMAIMAFLPWFSVDIESEGGGMGDFMKNFDASQHGTEEWNGWMALIFGLVVVVIGILPHLLDSVQEPLKGFIPLIACGLGFVLGPLIYLFRAEGGEQSMMGVTIEAGTTFWFWLSFLGGAAALAGAVWKKFGLGDAAAGGGGEA